MCGCAIKIACLIEEQAGIRLTAVVTTRELKEHVECPAGARGSQLEDIPSVAPGIALRHRAVQIAYLIKDYAMLG